MGPLSREDPRELGIVLVESLGKGRRRPYHQQKLALLLANLRHFALEEAERGVAVRHLAVEGGYREALESVIPELGPLRVMEPAERELRVELAPLVGSGALEVIPHEGWLSPGDALRRSQAGPPWRMDAFYRWVRRDTGVLMEEGKPVGGRFSFDGENRKPWRGDPPAAMEPEFPLNPVKEEVLELVARDFAGHPGELRPVHLPATREDVEGLWAWARNRCLPWFGPYEDAMSVRSTTLFHTRISALVNLHRLLPSRVLRDVAGMELPLAGKEGFIRQILGWREFVRHVHRETDGFRSVSGHLEGRGWGGAGSGPGTEDGAGAAPSYLGSDRPLPPVLWGEAPSGLHCLDTVVADVWREGYGHHITRLMVIGNLATLLDLSPRELTDWFWVAYTDAYDWVVEPNVLGMATFAVGDLLTTKPYVSGAGYLDRMGDYCRECAFDPREDCPVTSLYWSFLERHRRALEGNRRIALSLASAGKRSRQRKERDRGVFRLVSRTLAKGERVTPMALQQVEGEPPPAIQKPSGGVG